LYRKTGIPRYFYGIFAAMPENPPASQALNELGIPHLVFRHAEQVTSLEQAASERGQMPKQIVRSLLFRLGSENFVMVLVAGPAQVSWPTLRMYLGQSRLTMATEEEVLAVTGYHVGTVSPFGLPSPLRILADKNVFHPEEISLGSGERNVGIIMKSADLRRALGNVEIGHFTTS
jgi:Cys-tRNA(Pro)/Cys-tRNA(Cys) deacylase